MDSKEFNILIISETEYIQHLLSDISIDGLNEAILTFYTYQTLEGLEDTNFDLILIDSDDINQSMQYVKQLKQHLLQVDTPILIGIQADEVDLLTSFIEAGVNDYILKPYVKQSLALRIKNNLSYVNAVKMSKQKELQFDALLNNMPYMAWFKNAESQYITVNREFRKHSGKDDTAIYNRDDQFLWDGQIGEKCREYDLAVMNERRQIGF